MSLPRKIQPIKPHSKTVFLDYCDKSKRICCLASQKASKTRQLKIYKKKRSDAKNHEHLNMWKNLTRNRGIRKLVIKMKWISSTRDIKSCILLLRRNLTSLNFYWPEGSPPASFINSFLKSHLLKELYFESGIEALTNDVLISLFNHISHMPKLSNLSFCTAVSQGQLAEPPLTIPVVPSRLTSVKLRIKGLSIAWKNYINAWLLKNPNLKIASLRLANSAPENGIDTSLDNALKSVAQCESIMLSVLDFISLTGLKNLLNTVPGVFERICKLDIQNIRNFDVFAFKLIVPHLRNLVHFKTDDLKLNKGNEVNVEIIDALSYGPIEQLKTLTVNMDCAKLTDAKIMSALQRIFKKTNLTELRFEPFQNPTAHEIPLFKIIMDGCRHLKKLWLCYIDLSTDKINEISMEKSCLSLEKLNLFFDTDTSENEKALNQESKNLIKLLTSFKHLKKLRMVFYYPIPMSFLIDLKKIFTTCPLRKLEFVFFGGVNYFAQLSFQRLVFTALETNTLKRMRLAIHFNKEQSDGLGGITGTWYDEFNFQVKKNQDLDIEINDYRENHFYFCRERCLTSGAIKYY